MTCELTLGRRVLAETGEDIMFGWARRFVRAPTPASASAASQQAVACSADLCLVNKNEAPQSWEDLDKEFRERLYQFAYRQLGNADDAADVTQIVLIEAWPAIDSFDGRSKFSTWLFGIATHQCSNYRRKQTAEGKHLAGSTDQLASDEGSATHFGKQLEDPSPGPEEIAVRRAQQELMRNIVDRLPNPTWRVLITAVDLEEKSIADVAGALGMSVHAVNQARSKARAWIRERYGDVLK